MRSDEGIHRENAGTNPLDKPGTRGIFPPFSGRSSVYQDRFEGKELSVFRSLTTTTESCRLHLEIVKGSLGTFPL